MSSDTSIRVDLGLAMFHLDKSARTDMECSELEDLLIFCITSNQSGLAILVDLECLVLTNSMFSFAVYYIRGPHTCNIHAIDCDSETIAEYSHRYAYETGDRTPTIIKK